ncbi:hypothetical protein [Planobispora takensis]|uniref:Uncharacterized protein n=1 Tax=Planobispora takensis TaxID=1367882 RepID=A0A8J3SVG9_9ACTN|nr:hypothetical protein [Planobispora takensis]GII01394.1 hypothetical protein Pta02_34020 [Planobispora takensis]
MDEVMSLNDLPYELDDGEVQAHMEMTGNLTGPLSMMSLVCPNAFPI